MWVARKVRKGSFSSFPGLDLCWPSCWRTVWLTAVCSCSPLGSVRCKKSLFTALSGLLLQRRAANLFYVAAFVEFEDTRDADDAVRKLDGKLVLTLPSSCITIQLMTCQVQVISHLQPPTLGEWKCPGRVSQGVGDHQAVGATLTEGHLQPGVKQSMCT